MANKEFFEEFIEILKNEVPIWQTKSDKYKDKNAKQKSWETLLGKYKELDKNATMDMVKKKYQSMRACYRRELMKQRKSEKSGAGVDDIYQPTLWYFDNLDFLRDQEIQLDGISTMDISFDNEISTEPVAKKKKMDPTTFLETAVNHLKQSKKTRDEADVYGEAWAMTFRKLTTDQQIFAKRLMDDTLTYAQLGQLSMNSNINLGVQHNRRVHVPHIIQYSNSNSYSSLPPSPYSHFTYSPTQPLPESSPASPMMATTSQQIVTDDPNNFQELFNSPEYQ